MTDNAQPLKTCQTQAIVAAIVGVAACALLSWAEPDRLWRAYLLGYIAIWLMAVAGVGLVALGNLTGGRWAIAGRPFYLAAARTLPLVAILFIPIAMSVEEIYPWAFSGEGAPHFHFVRGKAEWLDPTFFRGRAVAYFVIWLGLGWWLGRVSRLDVPPGDTLPMRRAGALTLVTLVPTVTFAAFDWGMSLEPEWYSSIYGAMLTACGVLAVHALTIRSLAHVPPVHGQPDPDVLNDMGNLMLAFLMVTTYFSFSQFLIIWSGNLPTEISWYLVRLRGGWQWMGLALAVFGFMAPFASLLSRDVKRDRRSLAKVAVWLIAMYAMHLYWIIVPAFPESGAAWHATNVAGLAALGGGWVAAFCWHAHRTLAAVPFDRLLASNESH